MRKIFIFLFSFIFSLNVFADCLSPAGVEGQMQYTSNDMKMCNGTAWSSLTSLDTGTACSSPGKIQKSGADIQFCGPTNWISMNGGATATACSTAGQIQYDSAFKYMKWCDGTNQRVMGTMPDIVATYQGGASNVNDLSSYTFTGVPFGTAYSNRYIVVGLATRSGSPATISSFTIGGVTATALLYSNISNSMASFYIAYVPTGTTGDVVINFSNPMVRAGIGVWSLRNVTSPTLDASTVLTGTPVTGSIVAKAGSVVLGISYNSQGTSMTWTGITEVFDTVATDSLNINFSGAHLVPVTAQTVTVTNAVQPAVNVQSAAIITIR